MNEEMCKTFQESCDRLHLDFSVEELSALAADNNYSEATLIAITQIFEYLGKKKQQATIRTLLRLSHLPLRDVKTFDNFDFSVFHGKDIQRLMNLRTLSAIYAHRNLALIGPAGTGKTHLAQAFGYECCQHGFKTYFIKMTELRDKFNIARKNGTEARMLNGLVKPSCLIIDEVGHCEFDKHNTRLFFDMIDRRYNKEGYSNIVFTSNQNPAQWRESFNDNDSLLCAMDRLFDDATVFTIRGNSFRGQKMDRVTLHADKAQKRSSMTPTLL